MGVEIPRNAQPFTMVYMRDRSKPPPKRGRPKKVKHDKPVKPADRPVR